MSAIFIFCFLIAAVLTLIQFIKISKIKKELLKHGYDGAKMLNTVNSSPKQFFGGIKDSMKHSMFSFEYLVISNFGKDALAFVTEGNLVQELQSLRKTHRCFNVTAAVSVIVLALILGLFLLNQ